MIWHLLTHYWFRHDLLFTRFGLFRGWVEWNRDHFARHDVDDFRRWRALWAWVNVHG